ncbi:MAG: RelA/SpoT family protein, partial [Clostridia bacterium]
KLDSVVLRNMFLAIAKDIRIVIIKLADRLYNMQNIKNVDNEDVKTNMAKECLQIYAPIAHRLGMSKLKADLEDISFRILMPAEYNIVKEQIDEKKIEREKYIKNRIIEIERALKKQNINAEIYGRSKHFYSIYKKMKEKNCNVEDLFDLLAIRVIVNDSKDCYNVLGIVHDLYKPMPGRFKDYIAVPKTNMYQSLHTTVFGEDARPFEIQIRTEQMHKIAEYGVSAHFAYKEKAGRISEADKKLVWLRQTLEIQKELIDNSENLNKMKFELFGEEVFVYTPKGDIIALPKGSTPIDFAYAIHQKIAEKMIGARINSKIVPINIKLENTNVVDIITSSSAKGPNTDWLKYIKTTSAKAKITSFLKKQGKQSNIIKGKELLELQFKKKKITKDLLLDEKITNKLLLKFNFNSLDELYANIGFGSISQIKVINRLDEIYKDSLSLLNDNEKALTFRKKRKIDESDYVSVKNVPNCKIKLAKCCMPIPGDDIIGYITFSNGVCIHRKSCSNLKELNINSRKIEVSWKVTNEKDFLTMVLVKAGNEINIINEILKTLQDLKVVITELKTSVLKKNEISIKINLLVGNTKLLEKALTNLRNLKNIYEVKRIK